MKKLATWLAIAVWTLSSGAAMAGNASNYTVPAASESIPPANQRPKMPAVSFLDASGAPVPLSNWRGKVVLLNFWATWCAPCIKEMPALDNLKTRMGGPRFDVIALSEDRQGMDVVKDFFKRQKLTGLRPFVDTDQIGTSLGLRGLPTTILIDANGRAVMRIEGPRKWDGPEMTALIQTLLAEK